jgi:hypothetical protein
VRRAAALRDTPVNLQLTLDRAQLGQLTTLAYRRDRGWRGTASATAELAGTPAALQVVVDATVDDFRRYDIITGGAYSLRARCTGSYSVDGSVLSKLLCNLPAGNGQITLRGQIVRGGIGPLRPAREARSSARPRRRRYGRRRLYSADQAGGSVPHPKMGGRRQHCGHGPAL